MFLTGLPVSAYSADLPTSVQEPSGKWTVMHPATFPARISSALDQCNRDANVSESDALTLDKCLMLEKKLSDKTCLTKQVPDKIVFDLLNGPNGGIWQDREKATGRLDRALLCDLGDGVYAYWFTGVSKQSCNNIAIVLPPPKLVVAPPPPEVIVVSSPTRTYFSDSKPSFETNQVLTAGIVLENCGISTNFAIGGGVSNNLMHDQARTSRGYAE